MSFENTDRLRYLYVGLEPPYANPYYKHNYTSYNTVEEEIDGYCQQCQVEDNFLTQKRPFIGPYHHKTSERYSDGMPKLMYNYSGQQKCSKHLHDEYIQQRVEERLRKSGLYWEVPWQKYKTQFMYVKPTKTGVKPMKSIDKVNSTLLNTEKGGIRDVLGICNPSSQRIRTAFYEDAYPNWSYKPPNWTNYIY